MPPDKYNTTPPFLIAVKHWIMTISMGGLLVLTSCKAVMPYQKQYLNDHYMQTNALPVEKLENEADSYREGMIGGTDGKSGGGCGCN
jgi:hypothetical protein